MDSKIRVGPRFREHETHLQWSKELVYPQSVIILQIMVNVKRCFEAVRYAEKGGGSMVDILFRESRKGVSPEEAIVPQHSSSSCCGKVFQYPTHDKQRTHISMQNPGVLRDLLSPESTDIVLLAQSHVLLTESI